MQVNFWSFTRIAKALMRGMIRAKQGRIVAIGSVAALQGNPGNAAYAASKGALISYCRTLSVETAKRGVTVNVIAPGFIDTDMMAPYAAYRDNMEKQIPAGRFAKPEEIVVVIVFERIGGRLPGLRLVEGPRRRRFLGTFHNVPFDGRKRRHQMCFTSSGMS